MLSSFPTLRVVSRTSSFVYDKPVKVQQVGEDLNVSYVLEGSVRKTGDEVRVTAQLIDALTGDHVWADRYDEEGSDVAALQDDVANKLYGTLAGLRGEVMKKEEAEAWSKSAPSLEEYDYYLRGNQLFFRFNKEDNAKARQIWQEGLAKFPELGAAAGENSVDLHSGYRQRTDRRSLARHGTRLEVDFGGGGHPGQIAARDLSVSLGDGNPIPVSRGRFRALVRRGRGSGPIGSL